MAVRTSEALNKLLGETDSGRPRPEPKAVKLRASADQWATFLKGRVWKDIEVYLRAGIELNEKELRKFSPFKEPEKMARAQGKIDACEVLLVVLPKLKISRQIDEEKEARNDGSE